LVAQHKATKSTLPLAEFVKQNTTPELYKTTLYERVRLFDAENNDITEKQNVVYYKPIPVVGNKMYMIEASTGDIVSKVKANAPLTDTPLITEAIEKVRNKVAAQVVEETDEESTVSEVEEGVVSLQPTMQPTQLIVMQPDNIQKILSGEKTTTLRTESFPSGVYNFGGKDFQITNRGLLNVVEAGGVEAISKSEAFAETGPKYQSTKDFLAGKRKLYVYDIAPTSTQPSTSVKPAEQLRLFGNEIMLKDGKAYTADQLNAKMLLAMGYTNQEAGKIIKNNKC
jgi:hypothetical protein